MRVAGMVGMRYALPVAALIACAGARADDGTAAPATAPDVGVGAEVAASPAAPSSASSSALSAAPSETSSAAPPASASSPPAAAASASSPASGTSAAPASPSNPGASPWKISVGPGVYIAPEYPGARHLKLYPFPALDVSYNERIFSQGPDVLGVNVLHAENYDVGAALSFDFQSRTASDDAHLRGLGNVDDGPKLKLFADYTVWAFTGSLAVYQDITGDGQGTTASADLYASLPLPGWLFSIGPGVTWASAVYTRTLFGVSAAQSAASGLPQYATGSGIRDTHMTFYATHDFSKHWVGAINTTLGRLHQYAAHSPITERRTELTTFAALYYKF